MSPLWRDEIGAFLAPRKIVLTRMSRGLRPKCVAEAGMTVEGGSFHDWGPVLAALSSCLAQDPWRGANLRVVLSDHWARYAIVPWSAELTSAEERIAHARHVLAGVYGDVVEQWALALSDELAGRSQVASVIPAQLLADLRTLLEARGVRLLALQPQLIAAFNGWRHKLPDTGGWFVTLDEGSLAAARLVGGGWDRVHSVRIGTDWSTELQRLRAFGQLAREKPDEGRVFIDAPVWLRPGAAEEDSALEWLEDERPQATTIDKLFLLKSFYA